MISKTLILTGVIAAGILAPPAQANHAWWKTQINPSNADYCRNIGQVLKERSAFLDEQFLNALAKIENGEFGHQDRLHALRELRALNARRHFLTVVRSEGRSGSKCAHSEAFFFKVPGAS